jgi:hypothetical protein
VLRIVGAANRAFLLARTAPALVTMEYDESMVRRSIACLVVLLAAKEARAFCRTTTEPSAPTFQPSGDMCWNKGSPVWWKDRCVAYGIEAGGSTRISQDEVSKVARLAFSAWTGVSCPTGPVTIVATEGAPVPKACTAVGYVKGAKNNTNEIIFHDDGWPYNDGVNTLALTTLTFNADTGQILDSDIELNTQSNQITIETPIFAGSFDLQSILTHEAGHFFGLAHSGHAEATMYSMYKPQSVSMRTLAQDDIDGICTVYGSAQRPTATGAVQAQDCQNPPRGSFDGSCPAPTSGGGCSVGQGTFSASGIALAAWLAARARGARRRHDRRSGCNRRRPSSASLRRRPRRASAWLEVQLSR